MNSAINKYIYIILPIFYLIALFNPSSAIASSSIEKLSEIKNIIKSSLMKVQKDKKQEESLQVKIKDIKRSIGSKEKEINNFNKNIAGTNKEITLLSGEIEMMTGKMENRKEVIKDYIKALHKQQHDSNMIILVSANDYQDFIKKSRYVSLIADHNSKIINTYKDDLQKIEEKKKNLLNLQATLNSSKAKARNKKEKLQSEKEKKGELFSKVQYRRIAHEKKINKLEQSSINLQKMVTKLRSKQMPSAITGPGFQAQKGALPWPVNGKVVTTFGEYKDKYDVMVKKNGIDISVGQDENPRAIAGGRVVFTGKFEGYGNLLIIDHGNGFHSLYGNLSETSIQESSLLVEGMDVGTLAKSKKNDNPMLFFEIRHKGRPIDPLMWLQRRS
jgi:septal ring factor EnvC (AmiA/AmiB activator)